MIVSMETIKGIEQLVAAGALVLRERQERERQKALELAREIEKRREKVKRLILAVLPSPLHEYVSVDPVSPLSVHAFAIIDLSPLGGGLIRAKFQLGEETAKLDGNYMVYVNGRDYADDDISVAVALALPDLAAKLSHADVGEENADLR